MIQSPLLTAEEAATYLRLDVGRDGGGDPVRSLRRYVARGQIRPTRVGRSNRFWVEELDRFIRDRTEARGA